MCQAIERLESFASDVLIPSIRSTGLTYGSSKRPSQAGRWSEVRTTQQLSTVQTQKCSEKMRTVTMVTLTLVTTTSPLQ